MTEAVTCSHATTSLYRHPPGESGWERVAALCDNCGTIVGAETGSCPCDAFQRSVYRRTPGENSWEKIGTVCDACGRLDVRDDVPLHPRLTGTVADWRGETFYHVDHGRGKVVGCKDLKVRVDMGTDVLEVALNTFRLEWRLLEE